MLIKNAISILTILSLREISKLSGEKKKDKERARESERKRQLYYLWIPAEK